MAPAITRTITTKGRPIRRMTIGNSHTRPVRVMRSATVSTACRMMTCVARRNSDARDVAWGMQDRSRESGS